MSENTKTPYGNRDCRKPHWQLGHSCHRPRRRPWSDLQALSEQGYPCTVCDPAEGAGLRENVSTVWIWLRHCLCLIPQLPTFFTNLLTAEGDIVYDPFSGRGTTVIEAGILSRRIISNDINPLDQILTIPRFHLPHPEDVGHRLDQINFRKWVKTDIDLSMFYHADTLIEIASLKRYLLKKERLWLKT